MLSLTKNSSLAVAIGYPDFVSVAGTAINQTGQAIEGVAMIMLVYLFFSLSTSAFMNWYNKKMAYILWKDKMQSNHEWKLTQFKKNQQKS